MGVEDGWMVSANFVCVFILGVLHTQLKRSVYVRNEQESLQVELQLMVAIIVMVPQATVTVQSHCSHVWI